jgi:hypothetical protein
MLHFISKESSFASVSRFSFTMLSRLLTDPRSIAFNFVLCCHATDKIFQKARYAPTALPADFSLRNPPSTKIHGNTRGRGGASRSFEQLLLYCAALRA